MKKLALVASILLSIGAATASETIEVYKSEYCGCCQKWVDYMQQQGFELNVVIQNNLSKLKEQAGVTPAAASCHTAFVGGYFIEGHVPAKDVQRLLDERPNIKGIAVPGMPMGSPGMEGNRKDAYSVIAVHHDGQTSQFSHYH
ncbi:MULTISPECIES: DUF411 domain-containing protein [Echinimonadaceae]|uniref:DUF411 domain-containing protein n=3 Tax=Echinimonadaceae TaxID=3046600 RepID=A0A8J6QT44_9GAMM|nr:MULTISPECIES: DUF411 domain-containing protein [Echinimonadaceae]MBD1388402.1 DUF411 domain-containing protein [Neiella litorisoli]MBW8190933.1 DUF411 domain-containing protein [Neiella holothuriorum]MCM2679804.1 DUF411 domain-containing protein [Echinimonas agarilytica]